MSTSLCLQGVSEMAAEELEGWELAAMRNPRNWVRPALAVVGGSLAGAGRLVLGVKRRRRADEPLEAAEPGAGEPGSPAQSR
jgi:hypothetical protein